jgi:hypothetical protein
MVYRMFFEWWDHHVHVYGGMLDRWLWLDLWFFISWIFEKRRPFCRLEWSLWTAPIAPDGFASESLAIAVSPVRPQDRGCLHALHVFLARFLALGLICNSHQWMGGRAHISTKPNSRCSYISLYDIMIYTYIYVCVLYHLHVFYIYNHGIYIYIFIYLSIYLFVYLFIYLYYIIVYIYTYIYIHTYCTYIQSIAIGL